MSNLESTGIMAYVPLSCKACGACEYADAATVGTGIIACVPSTCAYADATTAQMTATVSLPHLDVPDSLRELFVRDVEELAGRIHSGEFSDWEPDGSFRCVRGIIRTGSTGLIREHALLDAVSEVLDRFFDALVSNGLVGWPDGMYSAAALANAEMLRLVPAGVVATCIIGWVLREGGYHYTVDLGLLDGFGFASMNEEEE